MSAAAAPASAQERFLTVGGRRWRYLESAPPGGGGLPVVLVHGAGGFAEKWRHELPLLAAAGYRALAVDLPGHRGSEGPAAASIDGYRDQLDEFAAAVVRGRFALVGHSMGGAIAQSFALARPDRLSALGLVGTGARLRVHPTYLERWRAGEVDREFLLAGYRPNADPALVDAELAELRHTSSAVRYGDFVACDRFDLMDRVGEIRVPTLVVVGREDRMTPVKYARYLADRIPGATLRVIEEAGHYVMLEQPAAVAGALIDFLCGLCCGRR